MGKLSVGCLVGAAILLAVNAHAGSVECWGEDDRSELTCTKLAEPLLLSLRGKSEAFVQVALGATGRKVTNDRRRFLSNFDKGKSSGAGSVNVTFDHDQAVVVTADVEGANSSFSRAYIWNALAAPVVGREIDRTTQDFSRRPYCSDLSADFPHCRGGGMADSLTQMQMSFNMTKAELRKSLEGACTLDGKMVVLDPGGDCPKFRKLLK